MIEAIDIWRTILAFAATFGAGYFAMYWRGKKAIQAADQDVYVAFSGVTALCGLTFFFEVLARV